MTKTITTTYFDIESGGLSDGPSITTLTVEIPVLKVDLAWLDPSYEKDFKAAARSRSFDHLGAAVAWARRQICRGEVGMDVVEATITENVPNRHGEITTHESVYDITLQGMFPWADQSHYNSRIGGYDKGGQYGPVQKRIRLQGKR